ncbi:TPA: hypothetical protein DCW61_02325 [Candidatus Uhrbacteria bacterium]|nr:hypothetical protein [Candidatus Uhrbacteria bacterium]
MITFRKISKSAAWFLMSYLAWLSFAVYLNYFFWFSIKCQPI